MTKAVTLAELADQNVLSVDGANNRVGIASTQPTTTLDVGGTVTAASFVGSGSGLTGVASTDNIITGTAATFTGGVTVNQLNSTGVVTATSFSGTVASSNLSGALPALNGSALTNLNIPSGFSELDAALFN